MTLRETSSGPDTLHRAEQVNRVYETLRLAYEAIVRTREPLALFERICRVLVEPGGWRMVWVGEIGDDGIVTPIAQAGDGLDYLDGVRISNLDAPEGRGPTGSAARERRHVVVDDIATDERMEPWREAALAHGFRSSASFPLVVDDRCVAVVTAYAAEPDFFDTYELQLLDRLAADLSFALEAMASDERRAEAEGKLMASEERFRSAAEAMLESVAIVSPVRDASGEIADLRYAYVNDAYCTLVGADRQHLIGRRVGELYPEFPNSERFAVYREVAAKGVPIRTEGRSDSALGRRLLDTIVAPMGDDLVVSVRDVTGRKEAERELRLRAELLDLAHDAVIVREPAESRVRFWNRGAEAMYGYSRTEASDRITHELLATEGLNAAGPALARDGRWAGELRHRRKDGGVIVVSSRQALARDEDGAPLAIIELNSDITERTRAEAELARIKGLLERTEAISRTGGWEYDVRTGRNTWTNGMYGIFGFERGAETPTPEDAIAAYDASSRPVLEAAWRRLLTEGEPFDLELGLIRPDGAWRAVRLIGHATIVDGRVVRVSGNVADVTERSAAERELRRAREELELAQRIAGLGSFSSDPSSGQSVWSGEMFRIFGRDPADEPLSPQDLVSYVHAEDQEAAQAAFERALAAGTRSELDLRIRRGDGAERVVHVIVDRDSPGSSTYSGTVQDVTRLRAVERELREQSDRAESASRAKSEFLARMSHELRTPLNSIMGFSQLLELEGLTGRQSEHVHYVMSASGHLLDLINDVLELSKIEAGQLTISPEPVALAATVAEVLALVAPQARERDVTLTSDTTGLADDGHVHADRQRLKQVLLNVLANAIKYNQLGGCVEVSFTITAEDRVRTTVADTGIGIAGEQLSKLFEPFERLGAEATQIEGTGLGLALSKRLVEAMGGTIEVQSTLGVGTIVTIELAGAQRPGADHELGPGDREQSILGRDGIRPQVILYIEDNLSNFTLVERILQRYPAVRLLPAMQATIGLDLARQHRPDLIVLDLHLPDMPGTEVLKRLKAGPATSAIPVIVLTADASKRQEGVVRQLGAADYLTKPLEVARFVDTVALTLASLPARDHAAGP